MSAWPALRLSQRSPNLQQRIRRGVCRAKVIRCVTGLFSIDHGRHCFGERLPMLGHLSFGVSDLALSIAFYDAVLVTLGLTRVWTKPDAAGYGPPGRGDILALKRQPSEVVPPGPGFHLAFNAASQAAVNAFHAEALRTGGTDNGPPGLRPHYGPTYYAAFVVDPDGYRLEAVCQ